MQKKSLDESEEHFDITINDDNKWLNLCKKHEMGNLHATTINVLLNQFHQNLQIKSNLQKYITPTKIQESFAQSAEFLQDNIVRDEIFKL